VIIFRLLIGLLADGITDIPVPPRRTKRSAKKLSEEMLKRDVSLVMDRHRRLASAFHEHMTTSRSYNTSNSDREIFYDKVTEQANQVNFPALPFL
jgi:hypothetical protein